MSDIMLHSVLNMPLPYDPSELDLLTWSQFRDRARQAAAEIERLRAERDALREALRSFIDPEAGEIDRKLALKDARALIRKGDSHE